MFRSILLLIIFLALPSLSFGQSEIIFDSINPDQWQGESGGVAESGSEITLAGKARFITRIEMVIGSVSTPRNVHVSIYSNDTLDGSPGTLLGQSAFQPVPLNGAANPLSSRFSNNYVLDFDMGRVEVPRQITVTINDDIPPGTLGTGGLNATPLVGGSIIDWSRFDSSDWRESSFLSGSMMMRIHAVSTTDTPFALGDCNQDGDLNFLDVAPFIASLISDSPADFIVEADIDLSGEVTFLDITPFIALLSSQ